MLAVPFQISDSKYRLFVLLEKDNLERIKQYDPAEVILEKLGAPWVNLQLKDVVIGYATAEEVKQLKQCTSKDQARAMLRHLSRGWAFQPERGDHDEPYESIIK